MNIYQFEYTIIYNIKADNEDDAIERIADLIKDDWPDYLDEGELIVLEKVQ